MSEPSPAHCPPAGLEVSASHQILPEYREFERTSTTVVNAYLVPVMSKYLAEIERSAIAIRAKVSGASGSPNLKTNTHAFASCSRAAASCRHAPPRASRFEQSCPGLREEFSARSTLPNLRASIASSHLTWAVRPPTSRSWKVARSGALATTSETIVPTCPSPSHAGYSYRRRRRRFDRAIRPRRSAARRSRKRRRRSWTDMLWPRGKAHRDRRKSRSRADPGVGLARRRVSSSTSRARANYMNRERGPMRIGRRIRAGDRGCRQCRDGKGHTGDFGRARARPARLHSGRVRRRGRIARLRPGVGAGNSPRAGAVHSRSAFGAGNSARRRDEGFISHNSPESSKCRAQMRPKLDQRICKIGTRRSERSMREEGIAQKRTYKLLAHLDMRYSGQSYELMVPYVGRLRRGVSSRARTALRLLGSLAPMRSSQRSRTLHGTHPKPGLPKVTGREATARGSALVSQRPSVVCGPPALDRDLRSCKIAGRESHRGARHRHGI